MELPTNSRARREVLALIDMVASKVNYNAASRTVNVRRDIPGEREGRVLASDVSLGEAVAEFGMVTYRRDR